MYEEFLGSLSDEEAQILLWDWDFYARPNQQVPDGMGDRYRVWLFRAGRGSGKTRAASETLRRMIDVAPRIALIAPTAADVRDVLIEGESGIMSVFPSEQRPLYEPSKRRVTFHNGAQAFAYSAEEPERLRGPQHHWAIGDEPASWGDGDDVLSNLLFGLRLGSKPWLMLTGTPKPLQWLRRLADRPDTITTTGSTYDNIRNLAPGFIEDILGRYDGTRLGRQEIYAEFLDDVEGALWSMQVLDRNRIASWDTSNPWKSLNDWLTLGGQPALLDRRAWRTIVAVDPPGETAECGIVVAAAPTQARAGVDHCVILDDMSIVGRPEEWGKQVVSALRKWHAEKVMVESNQGGDMVRATIHAVDPNARVEKITARVSKTARAEPISALFERGLVHHIGFFPQLESQMTSWTADQNRSPDRMDALVHAVSTLVSEQTTVRATVMSPTARRIPV